MLVFRGDGPAPVQRSHSNVDTEVVGGKWRRRRNQSRVIELYVYTVQRAPRLSTPHLNVWSIIDCVLRAVPRCPDHVLYPDQRLHLLSFIVVLEQVG